MFCKLVNTHIEAIWRGSLLGLLDRSGGFGGRTIPAKGTFLPAEPGESAGEVHKKESQ